ncbi:hypothetical protein BDZ85DRAFT_281159 [Elsinoe ampelina]|uniref:Uncharacterized protein n=1 Tax=Elsinoe ampelina TaxID=302913 RepID=A0A6A6GFX8_9PEZI|nr:hypothetical protein BDZ85DRAFT_281159 [Elsinoe ampelina]
MCAAGQVTAQKSRTGMADLPAELLLAICKEATAEMLKSLIPVNRTLYDYARPFLYRKIDIHDWQGISHDEIEHEDPRPSPLTTPQGMDVIPILLEDRDLARCVKSLRVFRSYGDLACDTDGVRFDDFPDFYSPYNMHSHWGFFEPFMRRWSEARANLTKDEDFRCWQMSLLASKETCDDAALALMLTMLPELTSLVLPTVSFTAHYTGQALPLASSYWTTRVFTSLLSCKEKGTPLHKLTDLCITACNDSFSGRTIPHHPELPPRRHYDDFVTFQHAHDLALQVHRLQRLTIHRACLNDPRPIHSNPLPTLPSTLTRLELSDCRFLPNFHDLSTVLLACPPLKTLVITLPGEWENSLTTHGFRNNIRPVPRDFLFNAISAHAPSLENLEVHLEDRIFAFNPLYDPKSGFEDIPSFPRVKNLAIDAALFLRESVDAEWQGPDVENLFPNVETLSIRGCRDDLWLLRKTREVSTRRSWKELKRVVLEFLPGSIFAAAAYTWVERNGARRRRRYLSGDVEGDAKGLGGDGVTMKGEPRGEAGKYLDLVRETGVELALVESTWEGGWEGVVPGMMKRRKDRERKGRVWGVSEGGGCWRGWGVLDM